MCSVRHCGYKEKKETNLACVEKLRGPWEEPSCKDVTVGGKTVPKERRNVTMSLELRCENTEKRFCPGQIHIKNRGLTLVISKAFSVHTLWPEFHFWEYNLRKKYRHTQDL